MDLKQLPRSKKIELLEVLEEKERRAAIDLHSGPGGLLHFVRYFWHILEPETEFVEGWALEAIALHLEATEDGRIKRLLENVPPGAMKSLLSSVFFPAWLWGPKQKPAIRFLCMSYSTENPERDNRKLINLVQSEEYQRLYGDVFTLTKAGEQLIENDRTGFKQAVGMSGSVTGKRADFLILDDPNNVADIESDPIRKSTGTKFREAASNRLNDMVKSVIIVIQQRSHEEDVSGIILSDELPYVHLYIPLLFEEGRRCETEIGWSDPRTEDGECFWPERYPPAAVAEAKRMGDFAFAGQYQQRPEPRGGGIFKREYWQPWAPKIDASGKQKWPACDYIIASLDPAFTAKQQNDPSALTVWGTFEWEGERCVMLLQAWRKWLVLHGPTEEREQGETNEQYKARTKPGWGLVEHVTDAIEQFKVDRLLIENKASGIDVNTEMIRLYRGKCSFELVDPKGLDKIARAYRVQPIFSADQVWAPWVPDDHKDPFASGNWRRWAATAIDEMASFPRGRFSDITDSATQALWWLREHGFLSRRTEQFDKRQRASRQYRTDTGPLYPV
jgi:hypothetical protein